MRQGIRRLVYIALGALAAACATDRVHQEGLAAVEGGHYEEGLAMLEQATHDDPANMTYRVDLKTQRDAVVTRLLAAADIARRTGKLDDAEKLYERVLAIVSGSTRAQRGLDAVADDRRHGELIEQGGKDLQAGAVDQADAKLRAVLSEDPGFAAALALREKVEQARGPVNVVPKVHARDNRPVTLQFRDANTKMVFEVLSRQSGINFVFDKDVKSDGKTTIYVQQVPVEQAIELVLGQNQLSRQVLSENMVLIYPNTAQKQKDYQDQIVKAVYLTNADPKQAQSLLKTMLNVKTTFIDDRASVIVIRDTPEVVHMAEKLLASLDLPEAEVMMEVEVLEITRSKLQQLGIAYPTAATVSTPNDPTVYDLFHNIDSHNLSVTPLSATVDLLKQVGLSNILASPRIRARNHEKAKILIGSRVPVITNSTVLVGGGTSAASSVQYLDVGLTLEVEPTIYLDGDVAIKVNLEVSNIIKEVQVGGSDGSGSLAYQIGTRNANTTLRLKDGETQILAGLINDQDTHSSNHVPGLGDIPVLGRLFGTYRDSADKSEIVLSITPRIIRSQPRPAAETTEFWYGTESSVRSAPMGSVSVAGGNGSGAPANTGSNGGAVDLSAAGAAPESAPAPDSASTAAPDDLPPAPPPNPVRMPSSVSGAPNVSWDAPGQANVGQDVDVTLRVEGGADMKNLRAQVHYDPAVLQLKSADPGDIVPAALVSTTLPRINQMAGIVQFVVNATPEEPARGTGSVMVLHFKAITPNPGTKVNLQLAAVQASGVTSAPATQQPLTIVIMP
ncbi:MAG TPA: cohesin domain-containing protein [Steroidobacteraceae bacterium]|nr:cohesin domain-containing protein [Steroidobacteraceae bacterium]